MDATAAELPELSFEYEPTPLEITNKVHTLQVSYAPGSTLMVGETPYQLLQFHFHTPSEHRLRGEEFPMELHLVHQDPEGELAVVGVMVRTGAELNAATPVGITFHPHPVNHSRWHPSASTLKSCFPPTAATISTPGSLTTPPCTEGVSWFVLSEPIEMSRGAGGGRALHHQHQQPSDPASRRSGPAA